MKCLFCNADFIPKDASLAHQKRYRFCSKRCAYDARIGKPSWMKGKTHSTEVREKISHLKKGKPSPRLGIVMSNEQKKKLSLSHLGKRHSEKTRIKISESHRGEKCNFWKGGISQHYKEKYYGI